MRQIRINADSGYFYRLRGIAILSVAYAHSLSISSYPLNGITKLLAVIGVPLFLICSGYFFKHSDEGLKEVLNKKIRTIVIPWLIWGTLAFVLECCRGTYELSCGQLLRFILGNGTWLYYVPVYLTIYFLYTAVHCDKLDRIVIILFIVSNIITWYSEVSLFPDYLTCYQNPLNFIGYFAIGQFLKKNSILQNAVPQKAVRGGGNFTHAL